VNEIEKSRIRLSHWIDHNVDHLKGYHEVATALQDAGETAAADLIRRGVESVEEANRQFQQAVALLSDGEPTGVCPPQGHAKEAESHSHEHKHEHEHHHAHLHTHENEHGHPHEEEHEHGHQAHEHKS
jgi:hypothetical protein